MIQVCIYNIKYFLMRFAAKIQQLYSNLIKKNRYMIRRIKKYNLQIRKLIIKRKP